MRPTNSDVSVIGAFCARTTPTAGGGPPGICACAALARITNVASSAAIRREVIGIPFGSGALNRKTRGAGQPNSMSEERQHLCFELPQHLLDRQCAFATDLWRQNDAIDARLLHHPGQLLL